MGWAEAEPPPGSQDHDDRDDRGERRRDHHDPDRAVAPARVHLLLDALAVEPRLLLLLGLRDAAVGVATLLGHVGDSFGHGLG